MVSFQEAKLVDLNGNLQGDGKPTHRQNINNASTEYQKNISTNGDDDDIDNELYPYQYPTIVLPRCYVGRACERKGVERASGDL